MRYISTEPQRSQIILSSPRAGAAMRSGEIGRAMGRGGVCGAVLGNVAVGSWVSAEAEAAGIGSHIAAIIAHA